MTIAQDIEFRQTEEGLETVDGRFQLRFVDNGWHRFFQVSDTAYWFGSGRYVHATDNILAIRNSIAARYNEGEPTGFHPSARRH